MKTNNSNLSFIQKLFAFIVIFAATFWSLRFLFPFTTEVLVLHIVITLGLSIIILAIILSISTSSSQPDSKAANSQANGSSPFPSIEFYLKKNLVFAESYRPQEWNLLSDLGLNHESEHRYIVRHSFYATNPSGNPQLNNWMFYLGDNFEVLSSTEIK